MESIGESEHVIACVASLLKAKGPRIHYAYMKCQEQHTGSDCGVFAFAISMALSQGKDPATLSFESDKEMRNHLKEGMMQGKITSFPETALETTTTVKMRRALKAK